MKENKSTILPLLIFLSILTVFLVVGIVGRISYLGLRDISVGLPTFFFGICVLVFLGALLMLFNIVLIVSPLSRFSFGHKYIYETVNLLFPLILLWGKVLHISRRSIERSFVNINNRLIGFSSIKVQAKDLLVISPHCLQMAACKYKITYDVNNCHKCGGCPIGAMLKMSEQLGFHFHVVTGGTLARSLVKKMKPKLILAIACERDLTSGIQDVYPLPAVGVLNSRPFGPCYNTTVDIDEVRTMIERYIIKEK
ncbi:DUF116 domain-containing protein [Pectinatus cerevisiiphilus]|uniref:DUF116 domain-containing protein n=1 Tax=Pectinatus cerevisiiphilus TaxID=86956 RepID=A0A4R3K2D9_9FIRM|nr:DUF116 domain-containing protein [Pectinatus cerevisiiphilus]TCS76445.1 hypothetical protein EDC37_12216 [Pectinatus cerevisiiphilus]